MIFKLPDMKTVYLLVAGSLLVQPVFSHGGDKVTAVWIDFDGTIATNEAFETLALAAYDSMTKEQVAKYPPWSYFGDVYYAEYLDFGTAFGPRNNISAEIAYRSSPALHKVESDSFDRVARVGIFNHIKLPVLRQAAAAVTVRGGFWEFVATAQDYGITPRVASLNWSVRWIRLVLREDLKRRRAAATRDEKKWLKEDLAESLAIYCSEILPDGVVKANKLDFPTRLHTGGDKVKLMQKYAGDKGKETGRVLFFGDSANDLPPLMLGPTTVGVVAGRDSGINATLTKFGIGLVELDPGVKKVKDTAGEGFLYQTDEFALGPWLIFPDGKGGKKNGY